MAPLVAAAWAPIASTIGIGGAAAAGTAATTAAIAAPGVALASGAAAAGTVAAGTSTLGAIGAATSLAGVGLGIDQAINAPKLPRPPAPPQSPMLQRGGSSSLFNSATGSANNTFWGSNVGASSGSSGKTLLGA